jgi:hypothetical protein
LEEQFEVECDALMVGVINCCVGRRDGTTTAISFSELKIWLRDATSNRNARPLRFPASEIATKVQSIAPESSHHATAFAQLATVKRSKRSNPEREASRSHRSASIVQARIHITILIPSLISGSECDHHCVTSHLDSKGHVRANDSPPTV